MNRGAFLTCFAILILSWVFIEIAQAQDQSCCCLGYLLIAPYNVEMECLYDHDYGTSQWNMEYTGYPAAIDACPFTGPGDYCSGCLIFGFLDDECDDQTVPWQDLYGNSVDVPTYVVFNDDCGNTVSFTREWCVPCGVGQVCVQQNVAITDSVDPELFEPEDMTVECVSRDGTAGHDFNAGFLDGQFGSARATDLCTNPTLVEQAPSIGGNNCNRVITRNFLANDGCRTTSRQQTVTIVDSSPPTLVSNDDISYFECSDPDITDITINQPVVTDSCDNTVGTPFTNLGTNPVDLVYPGKCTGDYTIERTWRARDNCGNVGQTTQIIVVEDLTPPTATINGVNAAVDYYELVTCVANPPLRNYVFNDACAGDLDTFLTFEQSVVGLLDFEGRYDLVRQYTLSDDCGNKVHWAEIYDIRLQSDVTLRSAVYESSQTRNTDFNVVFTLTIDTLCKTGYVLFDYGAATFVSIGTLTGCSGGTGGTLVCPVPVGTLSPTTLTLRLNIPSSYAPDQLEVRASFIDGNEFDLEISDDYATTLILL